MPATVTATGKIGPGLTVTAMVFDDVESFTFVNGQELLILNRAGGVVTTIDISAQGTITLTVSGSTYTLEVAA